MKPTRLVVSAVLTFSLSSHVGADQPPGQLPEMGGPSPAGESAGEESFDLAKAAQKSNNPVSDAWLLITQNDYTSIEGDAVDGTEYRNRVSFQPVMPIPIWDGKWNLVNRPVVQAFSSPVDDDLNSTTPFDGRTEGLGDTVFFSLLAPNRDDGFIWGVGPTVILPTATEDVLGQEKWQVGPSALALRLGTESGGFGIEHFNIGVLAQHWWSVAGDDGRDHTNQSDIQYFINWRKNATQLIGMTPNIQIDWTEDGSDRFTVPIGLGTIGFFKWGNTPVRWGVELQHYINQPDAFGPEWNLKVFLAPVKPNPFK